MAVAAPAPTRRRSDPVHRWRLSRILAFGFCWAAGLALCAIAAAILGYMAYKGAQYLRPNLIFSRPQPGLNQSATGGFLDPLLGTALLTMIGIAVATPIASAATSPARRAQSLRHGGAHRNLSGPPAPFTRAS